MKKLFAMSLVSLVAVLIAASASAGPKYGYGERGLWMKPDPDAKFTLSRTGLITATQWVGNAAANVAVAHVLPTGVQWLLVSPAATSVAAGGWSATDTGVISWSVTYSGDIDGGDASGLYGGHAIRGDQTEGIYWDNLDVGATGATIYEWTAILPLKHYGVTYGRYAE